MPALALLSGGLDSCVALAWGLKTQSRVAACISFNYGQSHAARELSHAYAIAHHYGLEWRAILLGSIFELSPDVGDLLRPDFDPKAAHRTTRDQYGLEVSATFVPGRNITFLAIAGGICDAKGYDAIIIGVNAVDYSGYCDCRPEFIEAMELALSKGLRFPIKIHAPLINMSKAEIIKLGVDLNAPLHLTWSCYAGGEKPCGKCPSCVIRAKGFEAAGIPDPALRR